MELAIFALVIVVLLALVSATHAYFVDRLFVRPEWPEGVRDVGRLAVWLGALLLVLSPIAERTAMPALSCFFVWPAAVWMGACFYLLLGLGVSDLLLWLAGGSGPDAQRTRVLAVASFTLGVLAWGARNALAEPTLREVHLRLRKWPAELDGYRIVQISDIHIGPTLREAFAERVVQRVHEGKPDLVVVTGDLVDGSVQQLARDVRPFGKLRAPDGVFFVTGNHDHYSGARRWARKVEELGLTPLRNERRTIAPRGRGARFELAGVDDPTGRRMGAGAGDDVEQALSGRSADLPVLLLAHDPRTFRKAIRAGVDLQISGHTHGGQMWPFSYLVRLQTPYLAGRYEQGQSQIYVSRGTGFWGPPFRVGAPAEVTVLVLHPATT